MEPTLRSGDRARVRPATAPPRFGDLILFRQRDYLVLHRFLGPVRGAGGGGPYRARGDGRLRLDPPVGRGDIVGSAVELEARYGRRRLDSFGARLYSVGVGFHSLVWGLAGIVFGNPESTGSKRCARLDAALLHTSHALLFRVFHRRPGSGRVRAA
jgi:hypothetical protein